MTYKKQLEVMTHPGFFHSISDTKVAHWLHKMRGCLNESGLRIIEVSERECELYGQADLRAVDVATWKQSYPLIFVHLPPGVCRSLVAVFTSGVGVGLMRVDGRTESGHTVCIATNPGHVDFETLFEEYAPGSATDGQDAYIFRIAANAVLHLAHYPDLYGRFWNHHHRVIHKAPSGIARASAKRTELVPQIIRLRDPDTSLTESDEGLADGLASGIGAEKSPHWRRGHWRKVPCGEGRAERKLVFIKDVLVNGRKVIGHTVPITLFTSTAGESRQIGYSL